MHDNLAEAFENGAYIKALYGALPLDPNNPQPAGAIKAIQLWLEEKIYLKKFISSK